MFRFDWSDLATGELLDALRVASGSAADDTTLRPLVADILQHVGGFPIAASEWTSEHRTNVGVRLLREAIGHVMATGGYRSSLPGVEVVENGGAPPLTHVLVETPRVDVNSADADALAALPVLGPALSERILVARRADGPFDEPAGLAARVDGLGQVGAARLSGRLEFADPTSSAPPAAAHVDLAAGIAALLAKFGPGLEGALDRLAVIVAASPHPATDRGRQRTELEPDVGPVDVEPVDAVEIVDDGAYLGRIVELIGAADDRVDVAMFYMAFSGNAHPNNDIVTALAAATGNGAQVRVVLDRDRPDDPYGSEIINETAIGVLAGAGIDVRVDQRDRLLHSKVVAVDHERLAIGSHNWTRASYERYRESTAIVHSPALTTAWHDRFDGIWNAATPP